MSACAGIGSAYIGMACRASTQHAVFLMRCHCIGQDRREAKLKEEIEKHRKENPKITEQFADLKRKLSEISEDEWQAIPEIGDYTIKNKQKRQSFAPVPDTLLAQVTSHKLI